MKQKPKNMRKELRDGSAEENEYYDFIEQLTDRELQECQSYYLRNIEENSKNIKKNVQFFFWATLISLLIVVLLSWFSNLNPNL
jgi:hypothetical protein